MMNDFTDPGWWEEHTPTSTEEALKLADEYAQKATAAVWYADHQATPDTIDAREAYNMATSCAAVSQAWSMLLVAQRQG